MLLNFALLIVSFGCDVKHSLVAQADYNAGRFAAAEAGFREISKVDCGVSQSIANWSSLASTLRAQGKYSESEAWFRKAWAAGEAELSPADPVWGQLLNSYALLEDELGRTASAENKFREALVRQPGAANIRTNLARLYTRLGRLEEAARWQEEGLKLEPGNPAQSINLAMIRRRQGRDGEAERLLRQALKESTQLFGNAHPHTITARSNLAQILIGRGKGEAVTLMRQNLELWAKTYPTQHPSYAKLLTNLGIYYSERKDYVSAAPLLKQALEIHTLALGPAHPEVAKSAHDVGALYHAQGKRGDAESYYRRALSIYPSSSRDRLDTLANLGVLYHLSKRLDEAEACYRELLALVPRVVPSEEARVGQALEFYEQLLRQRKEMVDAERVAMVAMRFKVRDAIRREKE